MCCVCVYVCGSERERERERVIIFEFNFNKLLLSYYEILHRNLSMIRFRWPLHFEGIEVEKVVQVGCKICKSSETTFEFRLSLVHPF